MKWNIQLVLCVGCALTVRVVFLGAVKQPDESIPFIATGEHHLRETRCVEGISIFVGDNATLYCNTNVTLVCDAGGEPVPRISWLFNGEKIGNSSENPALLVQNNSLVLPNVSKRAGLYTCLASNVNGAANASTIIKYVGPRKPQIFSDFKDEVFTANYKILPVTVGSNITAYGKSLIKLVCNASGIPRPVIEWSKENGKIERKYVKGDYLLLPHNVALSGRYVCTAKNVASETQLESHIQLIEPILPAIQPSNKNHRAINGENQVFLRAGDAVTTIAGTEVTIQCLPSGIPEPTVTWYHNGQVCPEADLNSYGHAVSFYDSAIQSSRSGNYTCVARSPFGSATATSSVHVIKPVIPYINGSSEDIISYDMSVPTAKKIGGSIKTLVGSSFYLECDAGGIPRPEVTWKKDNLPIFSSKRIKVSEKRVKVLGTMMSDTGWYSCIASNGVGTAKRSTFIQLLAPEMPRIRKPSYKRSFMVNNKPTPMHVGVGLELRILAYRELNIYCSATGFPPPVLSWEKNGYPLVQEETIKVKQGGRKLVFSKLVPSQNGRYACVASNAAGQTRQQTLLLSRMPSRPKIELRKSVLSKYQLSPQRGVRVYEIPEGQSQLTVGSNVTLECIASGYPGAKFKWFKDDRPIRGQTIELFNRSKLELLVVRKVDEGVYRCVAKNILGKQEKIIEIKLKDRHRHNVSRQKRRTQRQK